MCPPTFEYVGFCVFQDFKVTSFCPQHTERERDGSGNDILLHSIVQGLHFGLNIQKNQYVHVGMDASF